MSATPAILQGNPLPEVDVELVLEGSYPYVTGGVSKWIHDLIVGLPTIRFGLFHLAARRDDARTLRYALPENVRYLQNIYLHDPVFLTPAPKTRPFDSDQLFARLHRFHQETRSPDPASFLDLLRELTADDRLSGLRDLFFQDRSFALLEQMYRDRYSSSSFLDFFWTWRFMHFPLLQLLQARRGPARLVHAVCTGYAGYYASIRKLTEGIPVLLTEHGIYTRERNIEITQAEWIHTEGHPEHLIRQDKGTFKRLWINFFETLGHWSYVTADRIVTLFGGNRDEQLKLGADPAKISIIPNGILPETYLGLRPDTPPDVRHLRIGFIGRVVPIKDLGTFLAAAQIILMSHPTAMFHIIGPLDEDPDYAREMMQLADALQPAGRVLFHGRQEVLTWYPRLDVCVLTSLSEGQPLSIIEAMAAGIPNVATDIGGCRELIEGGAPEDRSLGACGIVTSLRSPDQTAGAVLDICANPDRYLEMVRVGRKRVMKRYRQDDLLHQYSSLYHTLMDAGRTS